MIDLVHVSIHYRKLFESLSKATASFILGNPAGGVKDSISAFSSFEMPADVSDLAYQLILKSLVRWHKRLPVNIDLISTIRMD